MLLMVDDAATHSADRLGETVETGPGSVVIASGVDVCAGFERGFVSLFDGVGRSSAVQVMVIWLMVFD